MKASVCESRRRLIVASGDIDCIAVAGLSLKPTSVDSPL